MPDLSMSYLAALQGGIVRTQATELRAGGIGAMALAS